MKINERWLREWVDPPLESAAIAEKLTLGGLEVDAITPAGPDLDGVVVAEVVEVRPHPDAERLAVCTVNDGASPQQVVCGAPNVRTGMKTAYARPGARLPDGRTISATQIRGTESSGMLCSAAELELGDDAGGIFDLPASTRVGVTLSKFLELDDVVFDIGLTPNRGDCFSIIGVARDLGVLTGQLMREPVVAPLPPTCEHTFPVRLDQPEACPRYAGRVIAGIDAAAATPPWLSERLRRAGVRSIHPVVDVTNYVMLELGQPMHAFDLSKLKQGIIVRAATADEEIELLDGQRISLDAGTLVIADAEGPVALAGVMGGDSSAVGGDTTDIFLESAYFDPIRLAGVARRHRLHTDASMRFERGVDPTMQVRAIERASELLVQICGGQPGPALLSENSKHLPARPAISFRPASVNRLLGTDIDDKRIEEILRALGMSIELRGLVWAVEPPTFRADLRIEADLIEEVARIQGYDTIPTRLPRADARPALTVADSSQEKSVRDELVARGYFEAITYSFVEADMASTFHPASTAVTLANPISAEMKVMRPALWPGLVNAARYNLNRQHEDVRLFEIGMVFADASGGFSQEQHVGGLRVGAAQSQHWDTAARETDFYDIKQDVEMMLKQLTHDALSFVAQEHPALHPGQSAAVLIGTRPIGWIGLLHPRIATRLDVNKSLFLFEFILDRVDARVAPQYRPISRYPAVRRDISVVVDHGVSAAACLAAARDGAGEKLRDLQLFDEYRGQGIDSDKKSVSLGLIFQDVSSTLTDEDVDEAVARTLQVLHERVGGVLRD